MYWGYSPALDLQEEVECDGEELRALLVGGCDARHMIKTLARTYRHPARKVSILVAEASVELVARQILLLTVALEPAAVLGPREKARLFMELYGNVLVRAPSARYLRAKAAQLALAAADDEYLRRRMPLLDLARMRHRERDQLIDVFSFWAAGGRGVFHPLRHWDERLRKHLGSRYDSRDGVFDWDYHMQLAEREGGRVVDEREYRHWRCTGLAFTWPGVDARCPNCSLASGVVRLSGQLCHHGYLGDIVNGPYPAYGITCEPQDADLLKTTNGVRVYRSTEVTERNLLRIFHELQTSQPYEHTPDPDLDGSKIIMELPDVQDCLLEEEQQQKGVLQQETYSAISTGTAQVTFLPIGAVQSCRPFKEQQDLVFVSQLMWESLGPAVMCFAREGTRVMAETRALVVGPREEALRQFGTDLEHAATECGCSLLAAFDGAKDPVARFKVANTSS